MILDNLLEIADNVSVAAAAGTAVIGDVIDLQGTSQDIGLGEDLYVVIRTGATEIITGGSAGTIQFYVVSDSLSTLGSATLASCTQHLTSGSLATGAAGANDDKLNVGGTILMARLPAGTYERYLGVLCTIGTTTVTAGTADIFLTKDVSKWVAMADAL